MIFLVLLGAYSAWQLAPFRSTPSSTAGYKITAGITEISVFVVAALVLCFFELKNLPEQRREAQWQHAYKQYVADTPSIGNQPEVQALSPDQVLVLNQFGDYVPSHASMGKTHPPSDTPAAQAYFVRYALPGAPSSGDVGPHVDVQAQQYPSAAWAKWEIPEQGFNLGLEPDKILKAYLEKYPASSVDRL